MTGAPFVAARGEYELSDDQARLDVDAIHAILAGTYWSTGIPRETVARSLAGSLVFAVYHRGVTDFEAMTDIAKTMRPWLAERFVVGRPEIVEAQHSTDGTRKWLLRTADGHELFRFREPGHEFLESSKGGDIVLVATDEQRGFMRHEQK